MNDKQFQARLFPKFDTGIPSIPTEEVLTNARRIMLNEYGIKEKIESKKNGRITEKEKLAIEAKVEIQLLKEKEIKLTKLTNLT